MNRSSSRVAVIGGHSAIATSLREYLPDATYFVRNNKAATDHLVQNYIDIAPQELEGYSTVINCAGLVRGGRERLCHANVALPIALASACRKAGVAKLIHVSSFAVYGSALHIGPATPVNPISEYGRSKLAGDLALLESAIRGCDPVIVRLPAIVDPDRRSGKVARLVKLWRALRAMPIPRSDVLRSMIGSRLAARVLVEVAFGSTSGVLHAADPEPFSYRRAAEAIRHGSGRRVWTLPLPRQAYRALAALAPAVSQSLFSDCVLEHKHNIAADAASELYSIIAAIAAWEQT